jgi:hypothetical protein
LAAALVALAPGLAPYEAAAQVLNGGASHASNVPVVPIVAAPIGSPALGNIEPIGLPAADLPALPVGPLSAPSLPLAQSRVMEAAALNSVAPTASPRAESSRQIKAAATVRGQLASAAAALESVPAKGRSFLDALFAGQKARAKDYFGLTPLAEPTATSGSSAAPRPMTYAAADSVANTGRTPSVALRAVPPTPVFVAGQGLNPGDPLLAGPDVPVPPAPPSEPKPGDDDWIHRPGIKWMMIQGAISIIGFIASSVAYPLVAIHAVGAVDFGILMALGPLASIATGPLNGFIADKLGVRDGLFILALVRGALALTLPALAWFGILNFSTLLIASIANGWQLSLLMTSEGAYYRKLAGRNFIDKINTVAALRYLGLQVILGLLVGIGGVIDHWQPMTPFIFSAALHFFVVAPLIWFKIPNIAPAVKAKAVAAAHSAGQILRGFGAKVKGFVAKFWKEILLFGGAVALYEFGLPAGVAGLAAGFGKASTLGIAAALLFWVVRTDGFKKVWAQKNLRGVMLLSAGSFGLIYPFQYFGLPLMAQVLGGTAGKGLIYGQLLGALFFGQLIANAGSEKIKDLGSFRIPFTSRRMEWDHFIRYSALTLGALWTGLRLFPGNWFAMGIAVAVGAALLAFTTRVTSHGWVKYLGVGLAAATLIPLFFWGNIPAIFAAVLMLGLYAGPASVAMNSYFGKNASQASIGNAFGASSSLNNAATSFGYGLIAFLVGKFHPAFPGALYPLAAIFLGIGAIFFLAAVRLMPGLPSSLWVKPVDKK